MGSYVRRLHCVWYPACLSCHVRNNKGRFTCAGCLRYKPINLDLADLVEDALACAHFLHELFFSKEETMETPPVPKEEENPVVPQTDIVTQLHEAGMHNIILLAWNRKGQGTVHINFKQTETVKKQLVRKLKDDPKAFGEMAKLYSFLSGILNESEPALPSGWEEALEESLHG